MGAVLSDWGGRTDPALRERAPSVRGRQVHAAHRVGVSPVKLAASLALNSLITSLSVLPDFSGPQIIKPRPCAQTTTL